MVGRSEIGVEVAVRLAPGASIVLAARNADRLDEQIAAIEVYVRQEFAPGQYISLQNNCGVVLVWTKLEFDKHKP